MSNSLDFIRYFLAYVENVGIYDEFDKDTQKMVTSNGVESLIKEAQSYLPEKLKPLAAANRMRNLSDAHRDTLIAIAEADKIIDMRQAFQKKMSINGGAQSIVKHILDAIDAQDEESFKEALQDAKALVDGPETI